jgi:hypothetical protein
MKQQRCKLAKEIESNKYVKVINASKLLTFFPLL